MDSSIEDVVCYLQVTATLAEMLGDKCLSRSREGMKLTPDALVAVFNDNKDVYSYVGDYGYISDTVRILDDRIRHAATMLDAITERELRKG